MYSSGIPRTGDHLAIAAQHTGIRGIVLRATDRHAARRNSPCLACLLVTLAGCGGGGGSSSTPNPPVQNPPPAPTTYAIGGTVTGLNGAGLALQNNGTDTLSITTSGAFTFATALANAATYAVTVSSQPAGQTCTIGSGSGSVPGAAVTSVSVTCADNPPPPPLAPVIVRQPKGAQVQDHGSVLFFVVAVGTDLNYEWRSAGGTVVKSGPEPFYLRDGLNVGTDDDDCWSVAVSNAGGSVVSNDACVSLSEVEYNFNEDGGSFEADGDLAQAFGNSLLSVIVASIGNLTGPRPFGLTFLHSPLLPGGACGYAGDSLNPTLDGAEVTAQTPLPPGQHTVSLTWNECRRSPDDTLGTNGAVLMTYDFPTEIGVGTYTLHFSGYQRMNGSVEITVQRSIDANNRQIDDIRLVPQRDFTIDGLVELRQASLGSDRIDIVRRLDASGPIPVVDRTSVDFNDIDFAFYDSEGIVASVGDLSAGATIFHSDGTATGNLTIYTSTGFGASTLTEIMGDLVPAGDGSTWSLELDF
jgi:hypothetical protein